jgi:hypothetical protein
MSTEGILSNIRHCPAEDKKGIVQQKINVIVQQNTKVIVQQKIKINTKSHTLTKTNIIQYSSNRKRISDCL